jgi:hypothetical protein
MLFIKVGQTQLARMPMCAYWTAMPRHRDYHSLSVSGTVEPVINAAPATGGDRGVLNRAPAAPADPPSSAILLSHGQLLA